MASFGKVDVNLSVVLASSLNGESFEGLEPDVKDYNYFSEKPKFIANVWNRRLNKRIQNFTILHIPEKLKFAPKVFQLGQPLNWLPNEVITTCRFRRNEKSNCQLLTRRKTCERLSDGLETFRKIKLIKNVDLPEKHWFARWKSIPNDDLSAKWNNQHKANRLLREKQRFKINNTCGNKVYVIAAKKCEKTSTAFQLRCNLGSSGSALSHSASGLECLLINCDC